MLKDCADIATSGPLAGVIPLTCIVPLVKTIVEWGLTFAGIVALFILIYSGIKFINSGGDPKNVDAARKTATYAILGLFLILFSFFIIRLVSVVTGVDCINAFGFNNCSTTGSGGGGGGGGGGGDTAICDPASGGTCPPGSGQFCLPNDRDRYACRFKCDNTHRSGWCPGNQQCKRFNDNHNIYKCQLKCASNRNGWCENGKLCTYDSIEGTYSCQPH